MGRTKRLVTPALRLAVCARDLRCVFPTCDRPSHWCDVHHLEFWADGGETKIENLVLLCRHHHVLVHEGGWTIAGKPGNLAFYRPDGSQLGAEPPPNPFKSPWLNPKTPERPTVDFRAIYPTLPRLRGP